MITWLEKIFRTGSRAMPMFWIFLILTIMIAACNALLISEFFASFSSLQRRVAGVPLYTAISSVYVLIELGCGAVIHDGVVKRIHVITAVGFVIAAGLIFLESFIFGLSHKGALPWFFHGAALALFTCTMGYVLRRLSDLMRQTKGW